MIRRRLAASVKEQDWIAVAIELIVVIVGVFIGIGLSIWNAARLQHDAAGTCVARIRACAIPRS